MYAALRRPLAASFAAGALCLLATQSAVHAGSPTTPTNTYREYPVVLAVNPVNAAQSPVFGPASGESGEPNIGWVPQQKAAMYGAGTAISRLTWDDSKPGAPMTNTDITPTGGNLSTEDTIVTVDPAINRTFFAELALVGSTMWYSDDAGATWNNSTGLSAGALLDHESIGAGPFAPNPLIPPTGKDAVYYCAQNSYNGACGVSSDGGVTFGPGVPAANTPLNDQGDSNSALMAEGGACSALHGHLKVGPDGTAYLPLKGCGGAATASNLTNTEFEGGMPSVSVSPDNGQTWTIHMNPNGSNTDESDNSVSIGPKNTVYMTWEDGTNISDTESAHLTSAKVSVSFDHGQTWQRTANLNPPNIHNVQFPVVIAGDDDRAAVAFLGTPGIGDDQQNGFVGRWDLYVATTYDQGRTWTTLDATPHDPVHRGCIDNQGIAPGSPKMNVCNNRNLLDFNDIAVDSAGRVLVAYTKTCTNHTENGKDVDCLNAADNDANSDKTSDDTQDYVLRQSGGRGLYAASDGMLNGAVAGLQTSASPSPSASPAAAAAPATLPNTSSAGSGMPAAPTATGLAGIALLAAVATRRRRSG